METVQANLEPERMRIATRSLLSLQSFGGLTNAALGLGLFAGEVKDILPGRFSGELLYVFSGILFFLAYRYIPKYYEHRFGHVDPPTSRMTPREALVFSSLVVVFLLYVFIWPFIGVAFGHRLDMFFMSVSDQFHVMIDDPGHLVRFGPILYCTLTAIFCFGRWRDRSTDHSFLRLMAVEDLFWIVFFLYPLHDPGVAQVLFWRIVSAGWLGISILTLGLFQHMRVVYLLPKRSQAQTEL